MKSFQHEEIKNLVVQVMKLHKLNIKEGNKRIKKDGYCIHMSLPHSAIINSLIVEFEEKTSLSWDNHAERFLD